MEIYGILREKKDHEEDEEAIMKLEEASCIISPDNKNKMKWNIWISLLLIYTGIFVPLRVAFYDKADLTLIIFELFVDSCFLIDIVLTFFSAYERRDG